MSLINILDLFYFWLSWCPQKFISNCVIFFTMDKDKKDVLDCHYEKVCGIQGSSPGGGNIDKNSLKLSEMFEFFFKFCWKINLNFFLRFLKNFLMFKEKKIFFVNFYFVLKSSERYAQKILWLGFSREGGWDC